MGARVNDAWDMILGAELSFIQRTASIAAICFGGSKAKDLFVEVSIQYCDVFFRINMCKNEETRVCVSWRKDFACAKFADHYLLQYRKARTHS